MRDVTSNRPLTRVINVTSSQSCAITIFSTGISDLEILSKTKKLFIKVNGDLI